MKLELPYIIVFDVIGWIDLASYPTVEQCNKYICLEYTSETELSLLNWIQYVQRNIANEIQFCAIIVFANFELLRSGKVAQLVGDFAELGSMFSKFPKGSKSFYEALVEENQTVQNAKLHNAKYAAERKKLLANI